MADTAVEAAPGDENDDSWLYGDGTEQSAEKPQEDGDKAPEPGAATTAAVSYNLLLKDNKNIILII